MLPTDKVAFVQLWLTIGNHYHYLFCQSFLEIYWYCLKDYSLADIKAAFLIYFDTADGKQFMPQPSDILRILMGFSPAQTALAAWTKVHQAIRLVGSYQSVVFDDFLIHAVLHHRKGWITLCQKTEPELALAASEFQKRYCRYLFYRPHPYSSHLVGLFEYQNQNHPQPIPEPLLFGHPQAALMTYLAGVKPNVWFKHLNASPQFARSAHEWMQDVVNYLKHDSVKTKDATELLSPFIPSPLTESTHESE